MVAFSFHPVPHCLTGSAPDNSVLGTARHRTDAGTSQVSWRGARCLKTEPEN